MTIIPLQRRSNDKDYSDQIIALPSPAGLFFYNHRPQAGEHYLTKKIKPNEGKVPQYYVKGHHPAIIDPEKFDLVQTERERCSEAGHHYSAVSIFSSKIVCGECGGFYGSKVWGSCDNCDEPQKPCKSRKTAA